MLSSFDFVIEYRLEKRNSVDVSFRRSDYEIEDNSYRLTSFFTLATCFLNEIYDILHDVCDDLRLCVLEEKLLEVENRFYSTSLLNEIKKDQTTLAENENLFNIESKLITRDDLTYFESIRLYVSKNSRVRVLKRFHDSTILNHLKRDKTLAVIKQ